MNLYWWVVNTKQDSGPTSYIVMAADVESARQGVLSDLAVTHYHVVPIQQQDPAVLPPGRPIII